MGHKVAMATAMLVILVVALVLRLPRLDDRPFHGDEAVHAVKFRDLWEKGRYQYDPDEYHGPTIYYAALPVVATRGRTAFSETRESDYRLPIAFLGAAMILLFPLVRDGLGPQGALWAALFLAVSAPFVFYSRYFIQETALVAANLALIACGWRYHRSGRTPWIIGAAVAAGLMIATKETAVLTFAALILSGVSAKGASPTAKPAPTDGKTSSGPDVRDKNRSQALGCAEAASAVRSSPFAVRAAPIVIAAFLALAVAFVFLSGFFSHVQGPLGYFETYVPWLRRAGGTELHRHPWHYYLSLLAWWQPKGGAVWTELFILVLAATGAVVATSPRLLHRSGADPRFARFLAVYSLSLCTLYSLIPYKTPWNLLSFYLGFVMLAGLGANALVSRVRTMPVKVIVTLGLLLGCAHLAWQSQRTTFHYRDDQTGPYAYAQPMHGVREIEQRIGELASFSPQKGKTVAQVVFKDGYYWPLPWYLRRLEHVGYWTGTVPDESVARLVGTPIVLSSAELDEVLSARLNTSHFMIGFYSLRPGVLVQMWVKNELWEPFVMSRSKN